MKHPNKYCTLGMSFGPKVLWIASICEFIWKGKCSLLPKFTDNEFRMLRQPQVNMARHIGILYIKSIHEPEKMHLLLILGFCEIGLGSKPAEACQNVEPAMEGDIE